MLILAILSIALLAQPICAIDEMNSPMQRENEYGIDPESWYQGDEVTAILKGIEEEAACAVGEAYDSGYKDGRIDGRDEWKPLYEQAALRAEKLEKRPTVWGVILGVIGGLAAGAAATGIYEAVR